MRISYRVKRVIIFGFIIVVVMILYALKNASFSLRVMSTIAALIAFYAGDHLFEIDFHLRHYLFMIVIVLTGFLFSPGYYIYPNYDKILHFALPIMASTLVFFMINKLKIPFKWKLTYTFFIVVGSLAIFEVCEFWLDYFFNLKLQGVFLRGIQGLDKYDLLLDANTDTMIDLMLGTLGTLSYAALKWIVYMKKYTHIKFRTSS